MEVSRRLRVSADTVRTWRRRLLVRGTDGLCDEPRPGVPRKITEADVARFIVKTLEERPKNATHWSTGSMTAAMGTAVGDLPDPAGVRPGTAPKADVQ
ncbi:helix-turn-helix domain-containing protein [Streptomyces coelicoflavus]|uniref:helix-turn-helix domain-containing protein n=1 Tax=Streptomyces coelicoflavus TaxID=285562 RepID=UPI0036CAB1D6